MKKGLPILPFASRETWEAWLEANHETSDGLWLKLAKKNAGVDSVTYGQAVDGALCYGWIDSQKGAYDENFYLQRFTPRKARSRWSMNNRKRATELMEEGKMKEAGLREIEAAMNDGRWERAYEGQSTITVPEDLQQKLDENPAARDFFAALDGANRYAILYRIHDAKKPETRARRIEQFVAMLNEGKTIH
ncbi:MAG TPA: YdeI/OmpD-associated family protein [Candidatus Binatia bacterium]|jgi:uncharacterized protein YdeI (YjbR/CyaY-like superfamily)|nr:YdeI/OmpD-associated family protein [Candidatus Binatia bacterium]